MQEPTQRYLKFSLFFFSVSSTVSHNEATVTSTKLLILFGVQLGVFVLHKLALASQRQVGLFFPAAGQVQSCVRQEGRAGGRRGRGLDRGGGAALRSAVVNRPGGEKTQAEMSAFGV